MLKTLLCTLVLVTSSAAHAQDAARDLHDEAVDHLNEGRITEAAEVLQRLIDEHPDYYSGYRLYWDALGKVADEVAMRDHVRLSLAKFERIPRDERTEDFYNAAMVGARYIEDEARKKVFEAEVIERFPRGLTAQSVRLDAARDAESPHEARSLYIAYMDAFPDNKSWVQLAARDCFGVMAKHSNTFTLDEMVEAAEAFDRTSVEYIPVYGNPTVRFAALVSISTTFLDRDPKRALAYADRGLEFVAEMAPQTDEFDETIGRNFDAVRFMAYAKLQRWAEARKLAADLIAQRGDQGLDLVRWLLFKEPQFRATYADALAAGGDLDAAHRQLGYAVALEPSLQERHDKLRATHPLDVEQAKALDVAVATFMETRGEGRKRRLLAREQNRPAPFFALPDLGGREVSIEDLRGKIVVLDFWATWCGPCVAELKEIKKAWEKYKDAPVIEFVAVSIDSDKAKVPPFVEKNDYRFRVLLGDGRIEKDYVGGNGIPQLYIIDREGNIRFHDVGFAPDHFLEHLDWMIKAALKKGTIPLSPEGPTGERSS